MERIKKAVSDSTLSRNIPLIRIRDKVEKVRQESGRVLGGFQPPTEIETASDKLRRFWIIPRREGRDKRERRRTAEHCVC